MADRISVTTLSAVASFDLYQDRISGHLTGYCTVHPKFSGNGAGKIWGSFFPDQPLITADLIDVTSHMCGSSLFVPTTGLMRLDGYLPYALRIDVMSLQAANTVKIATSF
jgi:hypothetical protein